MPSLKINENKSVIVNARRTESVDASGILKLVRPETDILFGRVNIINIIEKAVLAVTLHSEDEIIGHGAFFDYPNINSIDRRNWEKWFYNNYHYDDDKKLDNLNTLFVHYFVTKKEYTVECGREIIRTVFNAAPDVQYLILAVGPDSFPDISLSDFFKPIETAAYSTGNLPCSLFICYRFNNIPELYIRKAVVEDHDELTPIFNQQTEMLLKTYGRYFLAELIAAQDEHLQCLVAEVNGKPIAFLSITDDIDLDMLNECFELRPFYGFRISGENDVLDRPKEKWDPISFPEDPMPMVQTRSSDNCMPEKENSQSSIAADQPLTLDGSTNDANYVTDVQENVASLKGQEENPAKEESTSIKTTDYFTDLKSIDEDTSEGKPSITYSLSKIAMPRLVHCDNSYPPARIVPEYTGRSNAFAIQLFCINEKYETRSCDFLQKAFALFEDRDYCIVTIPHLVPLFPLLQSFIRVTPRCPSTLPQELYVFHRNSLLKDIRIRLACTSDVESIEELITNLNLSKQILCDLELYNKMRRDSQGNEIQAFLAESFDRIVGVSIVQHENNIEYVRSHYNIEDFIYFNHHNRMEHGHLLHFALDPAYYRYTKHFLREIMRVGNKTSLYYPVYARYSKSNDKERHSLVTCLDEMVPVHARRQIDYPVEALGINAPTERILAKLEPYALSHINRKLTMETKVTINARIVVVGGSDVGVSFLQTLAYCPHIRFNNLTLISPHGLPGELEPKTLENSMLSKSYCYTDEDYAKMGLSIWVNTVYGKMTAIDRAKKVVIVNKHTAVPYDHLILCTGQQYQIPAPLNIVKDGPVSDHELYLRTDSYMGSRPENCFVVNDEFDASLVLYWIERNISKRDENIIIYGNSLDTYTAMYAVLQLGIPGKNIILIQPPPFGKISCFNNSVIEKTVMRAILNEGITVHTDYIFSYWTDHRLEGVRVRDVHFISAKQQTLHLTCGAFLSYAVHEVDYAAFKAVNDACLVYDGKLVIDASFHTNDVCIRAAGPMTKFKRRYHVGDWSHQLFNSKEIGIALASNFLRLFDPTMEAVSEPPKEILNLIPIYRNAKMQGCILPGGYHYLHVQKPNLPLIAESARIEYNYGTEYTTGSPNDKGYFYLHINQYSAVETITCLSLKPFSASNLISLFGVPERFLNNIAVRYRDSLIADLFEFFKETWALIIYHDRFDDFCDEVRELMMAKQGKDGVSMEENVRSVISDDTPVNIQQLEQLNEIYENTDTKTAIEVRLLNYIGYNYYHLPMFAKPGMI